MAATSDRRSELYGTDDLGGLMAPESIAVVGASEKPGSFGGQVLLNAATAAGVRAYAVNPKATTVHGVKAFPSLSALPDTVDLVAICLPGRLVVEVAREAFSLGIRSAVIYSSGFEESGTAEGLQAQQELAKLAAAGLRILGPNCLGFINVHRGTELQFLPAYGDELRPGGIGVVAQSGALGYLLTQAQHNGARFSYWAAPGNSVDVDALDLANYMVEDPNTKVVVLVFEGTSNGRRLFQLGRRAAEYGKPVLVHKLGQSAIGAESARSHTGVVAGSQVVFQQAIADAGLVVVDHFDELIETASFFAKAGRASSQGVGVLSGSGGACIIAADEADKAEVWLPPLSADASDELLELLPGFGSVANPADVTAEAVKDPGLFKRCLDAFARDPSFGIVLIGLTAASESMTGVRARAITEFAADHDGGTPIAAVWLSEWKNGPGSATLAGDPRVPMFTSFRAAMSAVRRWLIWSLGSVYGLDEQVELPGDVAAAGAEDGRRFVAGARAFVDGATGTLLLDEAESKIVVTAVGIPTTGPAVLALDAPDLDDRLAELRFPVVAKVLSRTVAHKARVGGVRLSLNSPDEVRSAMQRFAVTFSDEGRPARTLVESMVPAGQEWFVGGRRDPAFGPIVTIGVGGASVEERRPLLLVAPWARDSIRRRLLDDPGAVGRALHSDDDAVDALVDVAERVFALFDVFDELAELDINPLIQHGRRLTAVDAALIVRADGDRRTEMVGR